MVICVSFGVTGVLQALTCNVATLGTNKSLAPTPLRATTFVPVPQAVLPASNKQLPVTQSLHRQTWWKIKDTLRPSLGKKRIAESIEFFSRRVEAPLVPSSLLDSGSLKLKELSGAPARIATIDEEDQYSSDDDAGTALPPIPGTAPDPPVQSRWHADQPAVETSVKRASHCETKSTPPNSTLLSMETTLASDQVQEDETDESFDEAMIAWSQVPGNRLSARLPLPPEWMLMKQNMADTSGPGEER
jgi:hypothetical protein